MSEIVCPKCGSHNVKTELKVPKVKRQKQSHPLFWWIFLGWIYLMYIAMKYMLIGMYWLCIGWWVKIIQKSTEKKTVHICQNCGNVF